jgi:hypothetical protein
MAITKVPGDGDGLFLPDDAFRSEAKGNRNVLASLAMRSRRLYELLTGTNPHASTDPPGTPRNPDGELGHNHSGPPWGVAFLHPIATISRKKASPGNIQMPTGWQVADLTTTNPFIIGPWVIRNRSYAKRPDPYTAPYSRAYLKLLAHRPTANPATLAVSMESFARDRKGTWAQGTHSASIAMTSTAETEYAHADLWVDLEPGLNLIKITFSSSAPSADAPIVDSLSLCQIVKQTH